MKTLIYEKQSTIFDAIATEEAKEQGMSQAAENKASLLKYARRLAEEEAAKKGEISMDDVALALHEKGISVFALGNTAGSVFKGKQWECTGTRKSIRVHSHGNLLRTWKLKSASSQ